MEEYIILVDENNQETGYGEKLDVHRKGILHRAFSIFVYDVENKKILMQHRAAGKYHSGNCWSNSCCSHQRKEETLEQSLARCIKDELGINSIQNEVLINQAKNNNALHCGIFHYYAPYETLSEHEMDNVFLYCVGNGQNTNFPLENIPFNPEEISELKWISIEELNTWLEKSPEEFSAWFSRAYALAQKKIKEIEVSNKTLNTGSGMWCLWDYEAYKEVHDYDTWEPLFCEDEDILKQIQKKSFVPLYIFEDGTRAFSVRLDGSLTEKEEKYVIVHSESYLFQTKGKAILSGIEHIEKKLDENQTLTINLEPGYYSVEVYLLAWDEDPLAFLPNGEVSPNALSDFVVLLHSNPDLNQSYRERVNTFSEDD